MNDLKKFLDKKKMVYGDRKQPIEYFSINDLGLFFWNRGGKDWVKVAREIYNCKELKEFLDLNNLWNKICIWELNITGE